MNSKMLSQVQTMKINKSLKIFKKEAVSFRRRDLEQFDGTDYLQDLSSEELKWYMDNCEDFLYNESTEDSKRRDIYAHNPIHDDLILGNYVSDTENHIISLLKCLGDKRLVIKHLKEELLDELQAFPEEREELELQFGSKKDFIKGYR